MFLQGLLLEWKNIIYFSVEVTIIYISTHHTVFHKCVYLRKVLVCRLKDKEK